MNWILSHRCDTPVRKLADRHYNRQSVGAANFVPPGRCLVLRTGNVKAFWVTSWPLAQYTKHAWAGAWVCSAFRNEGSGILSSQLIREAVAATRFQWPDVPELGIISFVDAGKVRHKRDPGRCFIKAGFRHVGFTKVNKLLCFQMLPAEMPAPDPCGEFQYAMGM